MHDAAGCADRDLGGFWRVVDLAQGGVALVHVTCWGRTTHVGGAEDARLQDYQVSSVRCHRFVTVTAAQKISFIFKSGRPRQFIVITNPCMFARARARRGRGDLCETFPFRSCLWRYLAAISEQGAAAHLQFG